RSGEDREGKFDVEKGRVVSEPLDHPRSMNRHLLPVGKRKRRIGGGRNVRRVVLGLTPPRKESESERDQEREGPRPAPTPRPPLFMRNVVRGPRPHPRRMAHGQTSVAPL